MKENEGMSSSLPEDVYLEVLFRVPAGSLVTCKCVCKSWFDLISHPRFVKLHLNHAVQKNNPCIMLRGVTRDTKNNVIHSIKNNSLSSGITEFGDINAIEMDYPFRSSGKSQVDLVGSCNGLVCIRVNDFFCLWNPATKKYKKLPESLYWKKDLGIYALGYDDKADDYKLVYVVDSEDQKGGSLVEVYTLRSNSWKSSIQPIPYWFDPGCGVLINGSLHWLGTRAGIYHSYVLISFEINGEKLNEIQLPKEPLKNKQSFRSVGVLEGCLCVLAGDNKADFGGDVWVMQDYGVQESWTKITVVTRFINDHPLRLMWSLKDGKIIFMSCTHNLVLYDLKRGIARELNVGSSVGFTSAVQYIETLVSLNFGTSSRV